jgi:hypothetical protein
MEVALALCGGDQHPRRKRLSTSQVTDGIALRPTVLAAERSRRGSKSRRARPGLCGGGRGEEPGAAAAAGPTDAGKTMHEIVAKRQA